MEIVNELLENGYSIRHNQELNMSELVDFCQQIGNTDDDVLGHMHFNPKDNPDISRVRDNGLFGVSELEWHSNGTCCHLDEFKEIVVCLYCVEECVDTTLSVLNQRDVFNSLTTNDKNYWRSIEVQLNHSGKPMLVPEEDREYHYSEEYANFEHTHTNERMSIVGIHPITKEEFLYWQPPFITKAWRNGFRLNVDDIKKQLRELMEISIHKKEFVFKKGDLFFMDQLLTLHKRSKVVNHNRELWRLALDYENIK